MSDLGDFVRTLLDEEDKTAGQDLSHLSIPELEVILGIEPQPDIAVAPPLDTTKLAYHGDHEKFLEQFQGTPLYDQAIALCEQELACEQKRLQKRLAEKQRQDTSEDHWDTKDAIRLKKKMLLLKLHKTRAAGPKMDPAMSAPSGEEGEKEAADGAPEIAGTGNVEYTGNVNTGEASAPAWPRAAMGVDAAGRKATPSEAKRQDDTATPQHVMPATGKTASDDEEDRDEGDKDEKKGPPKKDDEEKTAGQRLIEAVKSSSYTGGVSASRRGIGTLRKVMRGSTTLPQKASKVGKKTFRGEVVPGIAKMRGQMGVSAFESAAQKARSAKIPKPITFN